jgi:hypothetical protein
MLSFDFLCRGNHSRLNIKMKWQDRDRPPHEPDVVKFAAENGPLIVPLDAAPRWLFAKGISRLRFDVAEAGQCTSFSVKNIKLWQRTAAEQLPK